MTATVLNFHKHKFVDHEWAAICERCTAAEGEIPKHCPGRPMTGDEKDLVLSNKLDFIFPEGWTTCCWTQRMRIKGMLIP
jgi:hypothetical protein